MSLGRLGQYEVLERIGQGGMGVVFKARDTKLGRLVALKTLAEALALDPECRARLVREARAEACLSHSHIAVCYEVGEAAPTPADLLDPGAAGPHPASVPFLAMELVPGEDLLELIERRPLAVPEVLDLAVQIAAGLEAAHAAGVVHRDLKPSNVRVTPEGEVKILDFGLARIWAPPGAASSGAGTLISSAGVILGTAAYMAPEQSQGGPVDARSDLFSFGVLLYHAVTGRLPFTGDTAVAVFTATASVDPPPLARYASGVPDELERIVRKLLAKRPADRYQSAHEVLTDLRRLQSSRGSGDTNGNGRRRWVAPAIVLGTLATAAALVLARGWLHDLVEPPSRTLAVLDFENTSGDSTLVRAGAALAREVRSDLAQLTDLNVVSGTTTGGLPAGQREPRTIARELGVGSVLLGTVRDGGEAPRLEVELVGARTGFVRWSGAWDLLPSTTQRIQQEVVRQVAEHLRARLDVATAARATREPRAYDDYMRGMQELEDPDDPLAADRAADAFGLALARDPGFALAWAGRARALLRIHRRDQRPEAMRSAAAAAEQAVRLAPELVEAWVARSEVDRANGRTDRAIAGLKRAIARRPNWDEGCVQLAATFRDAGRLEEAERWLRRAVELRPDYWRNWNSLGALLLRRGDYAGARAAFARIVQLVPEKNRGYEQLAALDMLEGKPEQAIAEYRRLPLPVEDGDLASNIGSAYYYAARPAEALPYYTLAVRLKPRDATMRMNLGDCLQRLGRHDEARASYRAAVPLLEGERRLRPGDPDLGARHAACLAKAGECAAAARALAALVPAALEASADVSIWAAKAYSLCGDRARALAALRRAVRLGYPASGLASEDEFAALRDDPGYRRLTGTRAAGDTAPGGAATGSP
jgi:serine/threonine protein kinase/Flp pilus assembly protein TadD